MTTEEWQAKLPCLIHARNTEDNHSNYEIVTYVEDSVLKVNEDDLYFYDINDPVVDISFVCTTADLHKHMTKLYPEAYL